MIDFPTETHKEVFEKTVDFLKQKPEVSAITLGGSLARGKGSNKSDIDLYAYLHPNSTPDRSKKLIDEFYKFHESLHLDKYEGVGKYFHVGFDVPALEIKPPGRSWTTGPDNFELEIGNCYIYCDLVYEKDGVFKEAKARYTPYYDEDLRQERLKEVLMYLNNDIGHATAAVNRNLYFHGFKRLHDANREFLQALFITRKTYPIAYDKWIKEQLVEILNLPEMYEDFVHLYELNHLESDELLDKIKSLEKLVDQYIK